MHRVAPACCANFALHTNDGKTTQCVVQDYHDGGPKVNTGGNIFFGYAKPEPGTNEGLGKIKAFLFEGFFQGSGLKITDIKKGLTPQGFWNRDYIMNFEVVGDINPDFFAKHNSYALPSGRKVIIKMAKPFCTQYKLCPSCMYAIGHKMCTCDVRNANRDNRGQSASVRKRQAQEFQARAISCQLAGMAATQTWKL
jgi:hypothetical protein